MAIDINQILKVLPQKPPFLMIDRIVELTPGERAVAIKNVTYSKIISFKYQFFHSGSTPWFMPSMYYLFFSHINKLFNYGGRHKKGPTNQAGPAF